MINRLFGCVLILCFGCAQMRPLSGGEKDTIPPNIIQTTPKNLSINVIANLREVKKWEQPIISDHFSSLNGFLVTNLNNTIHYLLRITFEPGFNQPKYTSTIFEKNLFIASDEVKTPE